MESLRVKKVCVKKNCWSKEDPKDCMIRRSSELKL
jgi:hypothetical protein